MELNFTAKTYLQKDFTAPKIETPDGETLLPTNEPIGEVVYHVDGEIGFANEDTEAYFAYSDASSMSHGLKSWIAREIGEYREEQWNRLDGLYMQNRVGFSDDFSDILQCDGGEPYKVFYPSDSNSSSGEGSSLIFKKAREILLDKPPFCADGLFSYFHEAVGHIPDSILNAQLYSDSTLGEKFNQGDTWAVIAMMQTEINAWNSALGRLEPFLSENPYSALSMVRFHNALHGDEGLLSYRDAAYEAQKQYIARLALAFAP